MKRFLLKIISVVVISSHLLTQSAAAHVRELSHANLAPDIANPDVMADMEWAALMEKDRKDLAHLSVGATPTPGTVLVIGDLDGEIERLKAMLRRAGYVDAQGNWQAFGCTLIQMGDAVGRTRGSLETYEYLRMLQHQASEDGADGKVIRLLGNHEWAIMKGKPIAYGDGKSDLDYVGKRQYEKLRKAMREDASNGSLIACYCIGNDVPCTHAGVDASMKGPLLAAAKSLDLTEATEPQRIAAYLNHIVKSDEGIRSNDESFLTDPQDGVLTASAYEMGRQYADMMQIIAHTPPLQGDDPRVRNMGTHGFVFNTDIGIHNDSREMRLGYLLWEPDQAPLSVSIDLENDDLIVNNLLEAEDENSNAVIAAPVLSMGIGFILIRLIAFLLLWISIPAAGEVLKELAEESARPIQRSQRPTLDQIKSLAATLKITRETLAGELNRVTAGALDGLRKSVSPVNGIRIDERLPDDVARRVYLIRIATAAVYLHESQATNPISEVANEYAKMANKINRAASLLEEEGRFVAYSQMRDRNEEAKLNEARKDLRNELTKARAQARTYENLIPAAIEKGGAILVDDAKHLVKLRVLSISSDKITFVQEAWLYVQGMDNQKMAENQRTRVVHYTLRISVDRNGNTRLERADRRNELSETWSERPRHTRNSSQTRTQFPNNASGNQFSQASMERSVRFVAASFIPTAPLQPGAAFDQSSNTRVTQNISSAADRLKKQLARLQNLSGEIEGRIDNRLAQDWQAPTDNWVLPSMKRKIYLSMLASTGQRSFMASELFSQLADLRESINDLSAEIRSARTLIGHDQVVSAPNIGQRPDKADKEDIRVLREVVRAADAAISKAKKTLPFESLRVNTRVSLGAIEEWQGYFSLMPDGQYRIEFEKWREKKSIARRFFTPLPGNRPTKPAQSGEYISFLLTFDERGAIRLVGKPERKKQETKAGQNPRPWREITHNTPGKGSDDAASIVGEAVARYLKDVRRGEIPQTTPPLSESRPWQRSHLAMTPVTEARLFETSS